MHTLTDNTSNFPAVTVPDDSDALNASSVITGFQNLADRTGTIGAIIDGMAYQLAGVKRYPGASVAAPPITIPNILETWSDSTYNASHDYIFNPGFTFAFADNDLIIVKADLMFFSQASDSYFHQLLWIKNGTTSSSYPSPEVNPSVIVSTDQGGSALWYYQIRMEGRITVSGTPPTSMAPSVRVASGSGSPTNLAANSNVTIEVWRPVTGL